MTPITTSKGKFLAVKVPDGAYNIMILGRPGSVETNKGLPERYDLYANGIYNKPLVNLYLSDKPTFLFCTKQVTEEQAGEVVDGYQESTDGDPMYDKIEYFWIYKDYVDDDDCDNALDSLRTLLLAHSLRPDDNHAFLRVNE